MATFLCLMGIGGWLVGIITVMSAPAVTQEIAGLIIGLGGCVMFGSGAIVNALGDLKLRPQTATNAESATEPAVN